MNGTVESTNSKQATILEFQWAKEVVVDANDVVSTEATVCLLCDEMVKRTQKPVALVLKMPVSPKDAQTGIR